MIDSLHDPRVTICQFSLRKYRLIRKQEEYKCDAENELWIPINMIGFSQHCNQQNIELMYPRLFTIEFSQNELDRGNHGSLKKLFCTYIIFLSS